VAKNEFCTYSTSKEIKVSSVHNVQAQSILTSEENQTDVRMKVMENNLSIEVISLLE
jgi:hypothetical protein